MPRVISSNRCQPEALRAKPGGISFWLRRIGLLPQNIKPAAPQDVEDRIDALASARTRDLYLPPDVYALFRQQTARRRREVMLAWSLIIATLNLPDMVVEHFLLPGRLLGLALELRISITLVLYAASWALYTRRFMPFDQALIIVPCLVMVINSGILGLACGSAQFFMLYFNMSILITLLGIMAVPLDLTSTLWLGGQVLLLTLGFVMASDIPYIAEKLLIIMFYTSVMGALFHARHMHNLNTYRIFLYMLRDELRAMKTAQRNAELTSIAYTDPLTDVPNRRYFNETLAMMSMNPWQFLPLAVCMIDIDHFKNLNDRLGHRQGDRCLRVVATAIRSQLRKEGDVLARYGGEEFVLILYQMQHAQVEEVAERIRRAVFELNHPNPGTVLERVSISVGIALAKHSSALAEVVHEADMALYRAKTAGRNCVAF